MRFDGVEIKVNVFGTDVPHALDVLDLDDDSTMRIWFYKDLTPGVPPLPAAGSRPDPPGPGQGRR